MIMIGNAMEARYGGLYTNAKHTTGHLWQGKGKYSHKSGAEERKPLESTSPRSYMKERKF